MPLWARLATLQVLTRLIAIDAYAGRPKRVDLAVGPAHRVLNFNLLGVKELSH
jgi:hypothetical protein